ncbi:ester hydrolase C11orf54 homolog [Cataglyphis hispanica]|uniref:ester hydrolase C11orf54 homolog n=1 Tax=Cataglyphis hispanica TaxID=1086592 RepID=UPI002180800A|nr:ester hydrolase C11orf54 homolog [Cataglyphis hispanica]
MPYRVIEMTRTKMFVPEGEELAKHLQDGLRQNFEEATVEWVDCPDLTQEPFNFTAPGLCGDEMLLEIGGMSQLFPRPRRMVTNNFSDILEKTYFRYTTDHINASIIGAGIGIRPNLQFGELFVNASYSHSQVSEDSYNLNNQSRLAFLDRATGRCALESITDNSKLFCYPHGNFFISRGKPGKVLKVHAKKCIDSHFLISMESILYRYSVNINPAKFIGLGGTFVMKNGRARTHVMPYSWNHQLNTGEDINDWLHYSDLKAPLVAVGTFISNSSYYEKSCQSSGRIGYALTQSHFHAYSSCGIGGHFYKEIHPMKEVEYLGYFKPARIFTHLDPQPRHDGLQDFTDIMLFW